MPKFTAALALGAFAMFAVVALSAPDAEARTRRAEAQIQTKRGVAHADRTVTREKGSRVQETTVTGAGGATRSATDSRTWDREASVYARNRDATLANGATRSVDVDAQKTGEGAYDVTRTVTGANGETRTQTGAVTVTVDPKP